jgi:hypothetical protein
MKASISRAWDEARGTLKANNAALVSVALAFLILPATVFGTISPRATTGIAGLGGTTSALMLAVLLIGLIGRIGIARIAMGPPTTVQDALRRSVTRTPAVAAAFLIVLLPAALLMAPFLMQMLENPANPPPGASLAVFAIGVVTIIVSVRLLALVIPAAAAEDGGPIALLRRNWRLTKGSWGRLLGFVLLLYIVGGIAGIAAGSVIGAILTATVGTPEPLTVSGLVLAAVLALVAAIFSVLFMVMLARVYVQLGGADNAAASVPRSGD